jgi:hypothetical protein
MLCAAANINTVPERTLINWRRLTPKMRFPRNIADGDNVVVLMDSRVSAGRTWWCSNDEVLRTTGDLAVGRRNAAGSGNVTFLVCYTCHAASL